MKKKLFDLTIEEFTRVLCDVEKEYHYEIKFKMKDSNNWDDIMCETVELVGKYEEIREAGIFLVQKYPDENDAKDILCHIERDLFDYNIELSELDIYNFLEYKTDAFNKDKVRILLRELSMWKSELNEERLLIINEMVANGWEDVPLKEDGMIDYEEAKIKIWGYSYDYNLTMAVCMLRAKIEPKNEPQQANILHKNEGIQLHKESDNDNKISEKESIKAKKGRPKTTFKSKMICNDVDTMLSKLHNLIDGRKGREVALIIRACVKEGIMAKPTFQQVKDEFGDIGVASGYNKYASNNNAFTDEEIKGIVNRLKE